MLTLVPGSVLSVLHALWNYILNTHDYNSANLGSVYSTTCWNQLLPAVSLETPDTDSKFLFFLMSAVLGPPVSTFPPADDSHRISELGVTTKITKCSGFWTLPFGFQGHLRKRSRTQVPVLLRSQLSAEIHSPGMIKEFRVRGQT